MDDYDFNDLQSEIDNYFRNLIDSDGEEIPDDDISSNCDTDNDNLDEDDEIYEIDEDVSIPEEDDSETLGEIILQIQGDFQNSVLNDFSTTQLKLSPDQINILECCQNSQLKRLILLNRLKSMHCVELAKRVKQAGSLCCGIINKLKVKNSKQDKVRKKFTNHLDDQYTSSICKLGFPYFKKSIHYLTPKPNPDYHKKIANHELVNTSFIDGRRWIHNDQIALYETVCKNYRTYRKTILQKQLSSAKKAYGAIPKPELRSEIKKLKKQLKAIENETEYIAPPLDNESGIDWLSVINVLYDRHSSFECKSFWRIYLHPDINKNNWSKEENQKIHSLVRKHSFQNWDAIANELGTNRTGFLVIVHYFTKLCDKFLRTRFSAKEDEQILSLVEEQRMGDRIPWSAIATHFIGRSKHQLYHRYTYYLTPQNSKKGNFTEAEDILLCFLIEKFGKDYSAIANIMKTRTRLQLNSRYRNHLETINCNLLPFTIEDDREIMKHVEQHGATNWKALGDRLGKGPYNVNRRYQTITKHLKDNVELEDMRRSRNNLYQQTQSERIENLNGVLSEIKKNVDGIPTLKTIERYLERYRLEKQSIQVCKTSKGNKPSVVDQHLIEFFVKINQDQKQEVVKPCEIVSTDSLNRIVKLLLLLGSRETIFGEIDLPPKFPKTDNYDLIVEVKSLYHQKYTPKAGSFQFVPLGVNTMKEILPPTICTMSGLQNLLEIIQVNIPNSILPEQHSFESLFSLKNLTEVDEAIRNEITKQRSLFFNRLLSVFKWPIILSFNDPPEKVIEEERTAEDEIMKVPKILQAKSKKRLLDEDSEEDECDEDERNKAKLEKSDTMVKYYPDRVRVPIICDRKNQSAQCFFFLGTFPPNRQL